MMKKTVLFVMSLVLFVVILSACAYKAAETIPVTEDKKINIIATTFPQYDFAKNIVGDKANVQLLLKPGLETHSFEPSPQDIIDISKADMFIYTGGEAWVDELLSSMDTKDIDVISLMDVVSLLEEEIVDGMAHDHDHDHGHEDHESHEEDHDHDDDHEYDEHVWMSPKNAIEIVMYLEKQISTIDTENSKIYKANTQKYIDDLLIVDRLFSEVTKEASQKVIVVADRFPFRYLVEAYGLTYYAAFSGCSTQTDASPETVAFLIDIVKDENLPVVFYTEHSNQLLADTIVETTGCQKMLLHSCHNITQEEIEQGVTYITLMTQNAENLREALK